MMEGWRALSPEGEFTELVGPIFERLAPDQEPETCTGFREEGRQCNLIGICHGGMIAMFVDKAMGAAAVRAGANLAAPTICLTIDYISVGRLDDWIECRPKVLKIGIKIAYCEPQGTPAFVVS